MGLQQLQPLPLKSHQKWQRSSGWTGLRRFPLLRLTKRGAAALWNCSRLNFLAAKFDQPQDSQRQYVERWFCFKSGGVANSPLTKTGAADVFWAEPLQLLTSPAPPLGPEVPTDEPRYKSFVDWRSCKCWVHNLSDLWSLWEGWGENTDRPKQPNICVTAFWEV